MREKIWSDAIKRGSTTASRRTAARIPSNTDLISFLFIHMTADLIFRVIHFFYLIFPGAAENISHRYDPRNCHNKKIFYIFRKSHSWSL